MHRLKVIGFVCKFCAFISAEFGPGVKTKAVIETIELPCAGKIDATLILEAFEKGADAVFVAGCPEHECMNLKGSLRARQRIEYVKNILDKVNVGRERLLMYNVSGTKGPRISQIAREMDELLERVSPSPLNTCSEGKGDKL